MENKKRDLENKKNAVIQQAQMKQNREASERMMSFISELTKANPQAWQEESK